MNQKQIKGICDFLNKDGVRLITPKSLEAALDSVKERLYVSEHISSEYMYDADDIPQSDGDDCMFLGAAGSLKELESWLVGSEYEPLLKLEGVNLYVRNWFQFNRDADDTKEKVQAVIAFFEEQV